MAGRVMVVEDHDLLAHSLLLALQADGFDAKRSEHLDRAAVLDMARRWQPTVVLLDLPLRAAGDSVSLVPALRNFGACVVMVTGETDRAQLGRCLVAGALGIVSKSESFDHLVRTIKDAAELGQIMSSAERHALLAELQRQRSEDLQRLSLSQMLTRSEQEVLGALVEATLWIRSPRSDTSPSPPYAARSARSCSSSA